MSVTRLSPRHAGQVIEADLVVVGGGPVGLAIADRCARRGLGVLVLESGLENQTGEHEELNGVGATQDENLARLRSEFHGSQVEMWDAERQAYGVRCRGLGGSSAAWAGKSATFDEIDFEPRDWVSGSGWAIARRDLDRHIADAATLLGLSPELPESRFERDGLNSFYWQFARSRVDRFDLMRFGRDFVPDMLPSVQILLDATVTGLEFDELDGSIDSLCVQSLSGARVTVRPRQVVLAASAIENARLLLDSDAGAPGGPLNRYDNVGRYLVDHAGVRLGTMAGRDAEMLSRVFGFYAVRHGGQAHMFQHGLGISADAQRSEGLLNAGVYFQQMRAPDNPWDAMGRILRNKSPSVRKDLNALVRGSGRILRGIGTRTLASPSTPDFIRKSVIQAAIRISPNAVASEFMSDGLPHKLSGIAIEAISETEPRRSNRIGLGFSRDAFGKRLPTARWKLGEAEGRTLRWLAERVGTAFDAKGWKAPSFAGWVYASDGEVPAIDLAHTMGTTRMASDPRCGVVDSDCRVFGASNLFVAGGSVFPTSGHANPTWMYLAVALRLADHLVERAGHRLPIRDRENLYGRVLDGSPVAQTAGTAG